MRFCHLFTNCWCFFLSCLAAGRRNAGDGLVEKAAAAARRWVHGAMIVWQGDSNRCAVDECSDVEASIARDGRAIRRIEVAVRDGRSSEILHVLMHDTPSRRKLANQKRGRSEVRQHHW